MPTADRSSIFQFKQGVWSQSRRFYQGRRVCRLGRKKNSGNSCGSTQVKVQKQATKIRHTPKRKFTHFCLNLYTFILLSLTFIV